MKDSIDIITNVTIDAPNSQIIKQINVELIKPYAIHNLQNTVGKSKDHGIYLYGEKCVLEKKLDEQKTYLIGKTGTLDQTLFDMHLGEEFRDAFLLLEFYKEDATDKGQVERARDIYAKLLEAFRNISINVSVSSMPTSQGNDYNTHAYSDYIILHPKNNDKEIKLQKMIIQRGNI